MNVKDAVQHDVRQMIGDLDEENWSDKQIVESLHYAIRRMRNKRQMVSRDFGTHIEVLASGDLAEVHGLHGWALPYYVERVQAVYTNDQLTHRIPYKKVRQPFDPDNHWLSIPGYRRRLGTRYTESELYVQYVPRIPVFHWGTIGTVAAQTVELVPDEGFRQSRYDSAYKGWGFEIVGDTDAAAGDIYEPESSEFTPGANPTTVVTMDDATTINTAEDDLYAMLMPWNGEMDEALCLFTSYRLLVAEGHRRQAAEIQQMLVMAERELTDLGILEGTTGDQVVEDVN